MSLSRPLVTNNSRSSVSTVYNYSEPVVTSNSNMTVRNLPNGFIRVCPLPRNPKRESPIQTRADRMTFPCVRAYRNFKDQFISVRQEMSILTLLDMLMT